MVFEKDMDAQVIGHFRDYSPFSEVPIGKRRIDWIFVNKNNSEIVAVELKVKNWKNAFRQALSNTFCSHKSYIAIWHEYYKNINLRLLEKYGIGVLEVNGRIEEKLKPKLQNDEITESMKHILFHIKNVGGIDNEWE